MEAPAVALPAGSVPVRLGIGHVEPFVQVDLDDPAVIQPDLHAVGGSVVPDLAVDHDPAARVLQGGLSRLLQIGTGEGTIVVAVASRCDREAGSPGHHPDDEGATKDALALRVHADLLPFRVGARTVGRWR